MENKNYHIIEFSGSADIDVTNEIAEKLLKTKVL